MTEDLTQIYNAMQQQFRERQREKNAESIRTHHPEFRRHQKAIAAEIQKVKTFFEETIKDVYIAEMPETMLFFKDNGHATNLYEYPRYSLDEEPKVGFEIRRAPETPEQRAERLRFFAEKEAAKNPPKKEEEEEYEYDDT